MNRTIARRLATALPMLLPCALALAGCHQVAVHLPEPRGIEAAGLIVHEDSDISFPESAAGFTRNNSLQYDERGLDVSVGYTRAWSSTLCQVTIYVYPRSNFGRITLDKQLDEEIPPVRKDKPGIREVGRTESVGAYDGSDVPVRTVEFEHAGGPHYGRRQVSALLTLMYVGDWRVKYRVTTPVEQRDMAFAAADELMAELGLPPTGARATLDR